MYGDFSRINGFPPRSTGAGPAGTTSSYSGVWAQQGRVQLDSDLNEQTALVREFLRTLTIDVVGPFGGPACGAGFKVRVVPATGPVAAGADLVLGAGHYYVYGLRCEIPKRDESGWELEASYRGRSGFGSGIGPLPDPPFLVTLAVWERTVTAIQDPRLLEPALGANPPDTSVRSQVMWDLILSHHTPDDAPIHHDDTAEDINGRFIDYQHHTQPDRAGALRARVTGGPDTADDPTTLPTAGGYRGAENQLYRVEIHRGGLPGEATWKWSRDNGSVQFAIDSLDGNTAVLADLGRDQAGGLHVGDWVEIIDDTWTPQATPPPLQQVGEVDVSGRSVTLHGEITVSYRNTDLHPFLRRWDQQPTETAKAADNALPLQETEPGGDWTELEDGVHIQFIAEQSRHHNYTRGDYWLLPARTTGELLWPGPPGNPAAIRPHGPTRRFAPLALVTSLNPPHVRDLRTLFPDLTSHRPGHPPDHDRPPPPGEAIPIGDRPARHRRFRVIMISDHDPGRTWELHEPTAIIGRDPDSHIHIHHAAIPGRHAAIIRDQDRLTIKTLDTSLPVTVNDQTVGDEGIEILGGELLRLGEIELRVDEI